MAVSMMEGRFKDVFDYMAECLLKSEAEYLRRPFHFDFMEPHERLGFIFALNRWGDELVDINYVHLGLGPDEFPEELSEHFNGSIMVFMRRDQRFQWNNGQLEYVVQD